MVARKLAQTLAASAALLATLATSDGLAHESGPKAGAGDLCSKAGLMKLVPQFKNAAGKFQVPNPETDLPAFLAAQQGLSNAIDVLLAQANASADPYKASTELLHKPLTFGAHWRAAEIGIQTDGKTVSFIDPTFASYGGASFMEGIAPIEQAKGVFYGINQGGGVVALIYALPTTLPCVNRLTLAAANTAGSWLPPSYALGPPGGEAFLIVNICQDLGTRGAAGGAQALSPNAELFLAFQWADTPDMAEFKTDRGAHKH